MADRATLDLADVEARIRAAFQSVPPPPAWCLANSREGEEPELLAQEFAGPLDWRTLSRAFLDLAPGGYATALSFFADEAFRYYLPAYLIEDLRTPFDHADPIFCLTHGLDDESRSQPINPRRYGARTWFDYARFRFALFDRDQAAAIADYLRAKLAMATFDFERRPIEQALARYWSERARGER